MCVDCYFITFFKSKLMSLSEIARPVDGHLEEFNKYMKSALKTDVPLLSLVIKYMTKKRGKQVRPLLVLLSAGLFSKIDEKAYIGATMVELMHNATLIHDDVVDEADTRRGIATINASWNNKIAVLIGDFILARGLLTAINNGEFHFLKALSTSVERMSEGELLQIKKSKDFDTDEDTYFEIIRNKTASLMASCCEIGAVAGTENEEMHKRLFNYGEYLGIAFQIKDDLFDYQSNSNIVGKPVANDLQEKKLTLPIIVALRNADNKKGKEIIKLIKRGKLSGSEIKYIRDFVKDSGGIDYAVQKADEYSNKAIEMLDGIEDSEYKNSLISLAKYVIERKK